MVLARFVLPYKTKPKPGHRGGLIKNCAHSIAQLWQTISLPGCYVPRSPIKEVPTITQQSTTKTLPTEEQILCSAKDLQALMGIGKNLAYKLIQRRGFPSININGRYYVPKDKLLKWIEANVGRHLEL